MKKSGITYPVLLIAAALLIGAALLLTGINLRRDRRAETVSLNTQEELLLQMQANLSAHAGEQPAGTAVSQEDPDPAEGQAAAETAQPEMQTLTVSNGSYVGILSIPAISKTLPVFSEVSTSNLQNAPCRYTGSASRNNLVICAHNYISHFASLKNLQIGSEVTFTDVEGNQYHYLVTETEILQPTDIFKMVFKKSDLTLFTCTFGGKTRYTVRCTRIDMPESSPAETENSSSETEGSSSGNESSPAEAENSSSENVSSSTEAGNSSSNK